MLPAAHQAGAAENAIDTRAGLTPDQTATAPAAGDDRRLTELFYQLQVLQQEVRDLRGLVEEQAHQLNRLARDQQQQYIDLDRRVAGLSNGAAAGSNAPSLAGAGTQTPSTTSTPATGSTTTGAPVAALPGSSASAAGVSERQAYSQAFDLMKSREFEKSISAFNSLISNYPNGQYTPNAYYWLGELYLAQQNIEMARQSFMQVINLYPDHPKVPDTLYKLGVVYHRLGDIPRAAAYFEQVQMEHPQSSAAGLAASYAREMQ